MRKKKIRTEYKQVVFFFVFSFIILIIIFLTHINNKYNGNEKKYKRQNNLFKNVNMYTCIIPIYTNVFVCEYRNVKLS